MKLALVALDVIRGNGQGRINYEIVRHCLRRGDEVFVLADRMAPELVGEGVRYVPIRPRLQKPTLFKVMQFVASADAALASLGDEVDAIIGNGYTLRTPHDLNLCQFVHGAWIRSPVHVSRVTRGPYAWYQRQFTFWNSRWEKASFAAAKIVVAPSEQIRNELIGIGVPADKIRTIYNGVDLQEFQPGTEDRKALGLPTDVPLGLFVGDIRTPRKNLDTVLKALARVPAAHLAVVGGLKGSPFPALAARLGVASRTHFLGFRHDVGAIMRACDFFAFPSRYEAGSLVLLEAMASGLPVLTARTAGGSELVTPDCGTVLDDPDDVDGLARAMQPLAAGRADPGIASAARRVAGQHSWGHMASQYCEALAEAVGASRAVPA